MLSKDKSVEFTVHCHVGSLENADRVELPTDPVHCHVGSLEK